MKSIILSSNAFLVFILFLFSQRVTASSPYIPVTALDKFGNSVQLQNARQAAIRHGRLLVAAKFKESIVVVSVDTPKLGHLSPNKILEPVWSNSDTYLACTGIKADATFVILTMRDYCKQLWERTNVEQISQERLTLILSNTLLEFMGYNRQAELSDGISTPQEEKETTTWARPLGIQTLILTPSCPIVLVEPSGVATSHDHVCAIGKDSAAVMKSLQEHPLDTITTLQELKELLVDTIRQQHQRSEGKPSHGEIIVQVISKNGKVE